LVLSVGIWAYGPSQPGANEKLSATPAIHTKDGKWNDSFLRDTATWFSDHFYLRQELISVNNRISSILFQTSGEDSVILGKEGWLYFDSTLDNYTGQNAMTDKELSAAAHNLELMAQYCREQGKDFVFIIAPNKNSLYPQFMPDYGVVSAEHDAQKLLSRLENTPVIDLFSAFSSHDEILYFKTDSHWNSKGAALGQINGYNTDYRQVQQFVVSYGERKRTAQSANQNGYGDHVQGGSCCSGEERKEIFITTLDSQV
jgi:hypothetical protein